MTTELGALDPVPETVKLTSGLEVKITDMRTRQYFNMFRIITHGMANGGFNISWPDPDEPQEAFIGRVVMLVALSIGDAQDETIDFLKSMVIPSGLVLPPGGVNKQQAEYNRGLWARLDAEMQNPEPMDTLDLIEAIVRREAEDMQALGKRIVAMFRMFQRVIPDKPQPVVSPSPQTSTDSNFSEASVAPTTSYSPPMDGQTSAVETSPFDGFDRLSPQSTNNVTTTTG